MAYTITNNSPSAGCIQWSGLCMQYNGNTYEIDDGYTNAIYAYWTIAHPHNLVVTNNYPELANDDCLVFLNKNGIAVVVPGATALDGSLIVPGTVLTDAIAANAITGDKIAAGSISSDQIAANAIGATAIAAGAVSTEKLAAGAVTANSVATNAIGAAAIAAGAISTDKLAAGAVTADKLTANDIVGTNGRINLKKGTFDYGNGKLKWDGSYLSVKGEVEADSGSIGEWGIRSDALMFEKNYPGTVDGHKWDSIDGHVSLNSTPIITDKYGVNEYNAIFKIHSTIRATDESEEMNNMLVKGLEVYSNGRIYAGNLRTEVPQAFSDYFSFSPDGGYTTINSSDSIKLSAPDIILKSYQFDVDDLLTVAIGGTLKSADSGWKQATLSSRFVLYGETTVKYKKVGRRVSISGVVKPKSVITGGTTSVPIFNLPSGYRPNFQRYFVCQGTGVNKWLMTIFTTGDVSISRYGTTSAIDIPTTAWLPFDVSFEI